MEHMPLEDALSAQWVHGGRFADCPGRVFIARGEIRCGQDGPLLFTTDPSGAWEISVLARNWYSAHHDFELSGDVFWSDGTARLSLSCRWNDANPHFVADGTIGLGRLDDFLGDAPPAVVQLRAGGQHFELGRGSLPVGYRNGSISITLSGVTVPHRPRGPSSEEYWAEMRRYEVGLRDYSLEIRDSFIRLAATDRLEVFVSGPEGFLFRIAKFETGGFPPLWVDCLSRPIPEVPE